MDELLPVWLKPCGERLTLSPVNGAKGSSCGGVEGSHPKKTMKSGWMANTRRSGGGDNWPPVLLSESNVTPLLGIVGRSEHHPWCQGSGIVSASDSKARALIASVICR